MLYERARGTKLSQSRAKQALEAMGGDSTGMVSLPEFKAWWYVHVYTIVQLLVNALPRRHIWLPFSRSKLSYLRVTNQ